MTVLPILLYPDERLRQPCAPVEDFAAPAFQTLVEDLLETMVGHPGCVGVAAPQVGAPWEVLVMDATRARKVQDDAHGLLVVVNPLILKWSGMEVGREGCLSLPDYTGNVVRATEAVVQFQDRHGQEHALTLTGFEARIFQHEVDHLDGKLFIDRLVSRRADLFQRKVYSSS